jgi:AcrR family transcriptional regulator
MSGRPDTSQFSAPSATPSTGSAEDEDSLADRAGGPFAFSAEDVQPFALSRLPFGRHGLPREFVEENHRNRLMAGAIASLSERGYPATTVAHINQAAGVSNSTFYRHYADKEECVLATYTATVAWLEATVAAVLDPTQPWPLRVREALAATLARLDSDRRLARLCAVEIFATGPNGQACHRETVDRLSLPLGVGRGERALGADLPLHLEPTLIGGAISLIGRSVYPAEDTLLSELGPELTEYLLAPYLGVESARRVAAAGDRDSPAIGDADGS